MSDFMVYVSGGWTMSTLKDLRTSGLDAEPVGNIEYAIHQVRGIVVFDTTKGDIERALLAGTRPYVYKIAEITPGT